VDEQVDRRRSSRPEPLPRWAWLVIGVALAAFALLAWSLRLQQTRSLEVRDPDSLIGPAELVEARDLDGLEWNTQRGPFVHQGRIAVPFGSNPCPRVRLEAAANSGERVLMGMRVISGDCDDMHVPWVLLMTPEDPSLFDRTIEIVPLDETPPRSASSSVPYGTWSPPFPSSLG
jgi:hypothetical protein